MRVSINLASKPFVELRPLFERLRIIMAVLGVLAIGLGLWLHSARNTASAEQAQMDALVQQTHAYQQERSLDESRMHQPQNAAVLERSEFLNAIFLRKSFSWTAVMMDLENVLPAGVQVTNIEPSTLTDGTTQIRLRVSGDRDRAVQLVKNLERSQCFVAPRLASEAAQSQESGQRNVGPPVDPNAVQFDILAGYNPLPVHLRKRQVAEIEEQQKTAAEPALPPPTPMHTTHLPGHPPRPEPSPRAAGRRPQ